MADETTQTPQKAPPPDAIWRPTADEFPLSDHELLAAAHAQKVGEASFVVEPAKRDGVPGHQLRITGVQAAK